MFLSVLRLAASGLRLIPQQLLLQLPQPILVSIPGSVGCAGRWPGSRSRYAPPVLLRLRELLRLEAFRNGLASLLTMVCGAVGGSRPKSRHESGNH